MNTLKCTISRIFIICGLFVSLSGAQLAEAQNSDSELYLVAQKAFEDGFYDVAHRYANQLLEQFPETQKRTQVRLLQGQCFFFKGQYLKAYEVFSSLMNKSEYKDATLFWLGETYLKGADYKQAREHYKQLIELFPASIYTPQAYYSIGWVLFEEGKYQQAKDSFLLLKKKFPDHQLTSDSAFKLGEIEYNLQNYKQTVAYFLNYLEEFPRSTKKAEAFFYIAESYYYLEDPLTAVTYYAKTAEISYDNKLILMARVSLGWSYLKLEKFKLAHENFSSALEFAEEKGILSDDVFLGQATLYTQMEEYEKALDAYQQLITNFPTSRRVNECYLGMANIYYKIEKFDQAIVNYKILIDRLNEQAVFSAIHEKAYFGLAWSYLKEGNVDASVKSFNEIKTKAESKTVKISAMTQIGDAYQDVGELEKSIRIYDKILSEYPESQYTDYVQYRQGIALLKMEKIEAATLSFQTLRTNFPTSKYLTDISYYLAIAYFKKNNWTLAKHQITEFLGGISQQNELSSEATYILGLSQFNLKEYDGAIQTFKQIIKNYPLEKDMVRSSEMGIAKSLYESKKTVEAISRFNGILVKYPDSQEMQEALIWLGDHYLEAAEFQQAIEYYARFIESFPGSESLPMVRYEQAQAYAALNQFDQAIKVLNLITEKDGRDIFVKARLSIADIFSQELDPEQAIKSYTSIIENSPAFKRDAYVKIAEVHRSNKKFDLAIHALQQAIQSKMSDSLYKNSEIQFRIADTYQLLNNPQQAIDEYMKIPYLYADDQSVVVKAYLRVGRIFEDDEKWEEAKNAYQKVVDSKASEMKFANERLDWIKQYGL